VRRRIGDRRVLGLVKAFLKAGILGEDGAIRDTITGTRRVAFSRPCSATWPCRCWTSTSSSTAGQGPVVGAGTATTPAPAQLTGSCGMRMTSWCWWPAPANTPRRSKSRSRWCWPPSACDGRAEKTTICHIDEGFDFLGWRIQRHQQRGSQRRYVYTDPSRKALAAVKAKVRAITGQTTNQPLQVVPHRLNWVLRGWANYFRHGASAKTFADLDAFTWRRVIRWLCRKHQHSGWRSVCRRWLPGWRRPKGRSRCLTRARSPSGAIATGAPPSPPRGRQRLDRPADPSGRGLWRARCGPTRTPGSKVRAGETDCPRGRHRARLDPTGRCWRRQASSCCWAGARHVKILPGRKTPSMSSSGGIGCRLS
jgi:Group II intron, maturase-specific domain